MAATLAQRPHFQDVAHLGMRLLSRYFDDADSAILLMGESQPEIFASSGWSVGARPEAALGYALDVVVSGSTLIVPDLAALPAGAGRRPGGHWRLFAAVPVHAAGWRAIGAVALADSRPVPFDVHDLAILEHIAQRLGAVFSGAEGPGLLQGPGILLAESWRHFLGCEVKHLAPGRTLAVALADLPGEAITPGSPDHMDYLERAIGKLVERLPARTALGRLGPDVVAGYSVVEHAEAGERALLSLLQALEEEPHRACAGIISAAGLAPGEGSPALLEVARWLLDSAVARGPGTTLAARIAPAAIEYRQAS